MKRLLFFPLALLLFLLVLFVDGRLLPQTSLLVLYLLPVLVASLSGMWAGLGMALLSAAAESLWGRGLGSISGLEPSLLWNFASALIILGLTAFLFSSLRTAGFEAGRHSRYDALTGLYSLNHFLERSQEEMRRACRTRKPLSLAYLDIDDLKNVNDLLGFSQGDRLMKAFAEDLKSHTRTSDLAARLGGDEFVILFPEAGVEQARGAVAKIQRSFQEIARNLGCQATLSLGLVTIFNPEMKIEEAMKKAYDLLTEAKEQGANQIKEGAMG